MIGVTISSSPKSYAVTVLRNMKLFKKIITYSVLLFLGVSSAFSTNKECYFSVQNDTGESNYKLKVRNGFYYENLRFRVTFDRSPYDHDHDHDWLIRNSTNINKMSLPADSEKRSEKIAVSFPNYQNSMSQFITLYLTCDETYGNEKTPLGSVFPCGQTFRLSQPTLIETILISFKKLNVEFVDVPDTIYPFAKGYDYYSLDADVIVNNSKHALLIVNENYTKGFTKHLFDENVIYKNSHNALMNDSKCNCQ